MTYRLYVFTGPKGSGKSTALLGMVPPSEIDSAICIDTENSMSDVIAQGIEFGAYVNMYERIPTTIDMLEEIARDNPPWVGEKGRSQWVDYYEFFVKKLNVLLDGEKQYKYLLIDTIEPIEAAMTAAVELGRRVFGWSGTRAYGRMETEGVRPLYHGLLEAVSRRGIETIGVSSHIKQKWHDDKPVPGKVTAGGRLAVLSHLSAGMFWLVQTGENADGAPAALVLKARMGQYKPAEDGDYWELRRVLPRRIPHFTWRDVDLYRANPADLCNPAQGETLSEEEEEMISELFTNKQMELMIMGTRLELAEKQAEQASAEAVPQVATSDDPVLARVMKSKQERAISLHNQGKSVSQIARELDLPAPMVKRYLREL